MRSTFHNLEVAKRGLYAQQTAISTTGHNIANANTIGYSRQTVNFAASKPMEMPAMNRSVAPGQLGTGVDFNSIHRIREAFLDQQYRNEAQSHGYWNTQKNTLEKIELIFNEPSDQGLHSVIDQFWNAWQDVSRDPDNMTARTVLKERTLALVDTFQHLDNKLSQLSSDLSSSLDIKVSEANTYLNQIAQLNREIRRIEGMGQNANDLRDQRDLLTDNLSHLVDINVQETSNSMYNITLRDGTQLVHGIEHTQLAVNSAGTGIEALVIGTEDEYNAVTMAAGEIAGILKSQATVTEYQEHLDTILKGMIYGDVEVTIPAGSILAEDVLDANGDLLIAANTVVSADTKVTVQGINGLHQLGWGVSKEDGSAVGGLHLFEPVDPDDFSIADLKLNQEILNDVGKLAVSLRMDLDTGEVYEGNGGLALIMGQLRDSAFQFDGDSVQQGTFDDYYRSIIGGLGVQTQEAQRQTNNQELLLLSINNQRQSVSGVSLDEEMANLIKFQHAYNASARLMTTVDQLLDTIINRTGMVGR